MKQTYHSNATTNVHIHCELTKSDLPMNQLLEKYNVSENIVLKWKNSEELHDCSSRWNPTYLNF